MKTKLRTNNTSGINEEIRVNGQKLSTVTSFTYLGSVVSYVGFKPDILSRTAQKTAALTRLKPVWNDSSISLSFNIRLMRSLVTSIFPCGCESWTLTPELQRRIQAMEMRCYRKILGMTIFMVRVSFGQGDVNLAIRDTSRRSNDIIPKLATSKGAEWLFSGTETTLDYYGKL